MLSDFSNRSYYILVPLTIEAAKEKSFYIIDTKADAKHIKLNKLKVTNTVSEDYDKCDNNKCNNDKCNNDACNNALLLDSNPLSNSNLLSGKLLLDNKCLLDNNALSNNMRLLSDNDLFNSKLLLDDNPLFNKLITNKDEEDYKGEEGKDNTNANLQDFIKYK